MKWNEVACSDEADVWTGDGPAFSDFVYYIVYVFIIIIIIFCRTNATVHYSTFFFL